MARGRDVTEQAAGLRYNEGKARVDLIPADFLLELGRHYGKGAEKYTVIHENVEPENADKIINSLGAFSQFSSYDSETKKLVVKGDYNWLRGMDWSKCYASLMRHLLEWKNGESHDAETGSHLMVAVAWNAITLYVYETQGIGFDDRV